MTITITERNCDIGEALNRAIHSSITGVMDKFHESAFTANVKIEHAGSSFQFQVYVRTSSGDEMRVDETNSNAYAAVENIAKHMEKQLRRSKRQRTSSRTRHHP